MEASRRNLGAVRTRTAPPFQEDRMYKIEKGIVAPKRFAKYPFRMMSVGESFEADNGDRHRIHSAAGQFGRRYNQKFIVRRVSKTKCRCWRVK